MRPSLRCWGPAPRPQVAFLADGVLSLTGSNPARLQSFRIRAQRAKRER